MSSDAAEAVAAMIASRAEERQTAFERRQTAKAELEVVKADLKKRRRYGLIARHSARLSRQVAAEIANPLMAIE